MNRSIYRSLVVPAAALVVVVFAGGVAVRAQQGTGVAGRVGAALDNTGRAIKGTVQNAFAKSRTQVHTMEILDRVYSRIHWDKSLTASTVEIEVRAGGVTVLRGVVPDEKAKETAVDLAKNTVGVVQVVNELTVAKETEITEPAPVIESPVK